jgi:hypothetical protein
MVDRFLARIAELEIAYEAIARQLRELQQSRASIEANVLRDALVKIVAEFGNNKPDLVKIGAIAETAIQQESKG